MNIHDIAEQAGVSKGTVSKYLNKSGYVGKATAARIQAVIDRHHYAPSKLAQALSRGGSLKLVGLICYDVCDLYYAECASVLERRLREAGFEMILSCTGRSAKAVREAVDSLARKNVDALIFIGSVFMEESGVIASAAKKRPCFLINANLPAENVYCCYCDDGEAVEAASREVLASGRKRLLYLYDAETYGAETKIRGFLRAVPDRNAVVRCGGNFSELLGSLPGLLAERRPDALLCSNDLIAAAAVRAAGLSGLRVPDDLAVIGHNDSLLAEASSPSLTSIDNKVERLSEITADNLVCRFGGKPFEKEIRVGWTLTRRESF